MINTVFVFYDVLKLSHVQNISMLRFLFMFKEKYSSFLREIKF